VDPVVTLQTRKTGKRLAASLAVVRSVSSVSSCVTAQCDSLSEAFVTVVTLKWLFSCVNARVSSQVRVLRERLVAKLATKRPIPGVRSDVIPKMRRFPKGLLTVHALKPLLLLPSLFFLR